MALTEKQMAKLNELVTMADSVSEGIAKRIDAERAQGLNSTRLPHHIVEEMAAAMQDLATLALAAAGLAPGPT